MTPENSTATESRSDHRCGDTQQLHPRRIVGRHNQSEGGTFCPVRARLVTDLPTICPLGLKISSSFSPLSWALSLFLHL